MAERTSKVLLVDDDPAFLEVYATLLGRHFTVESASGPATALGLVASSGPYAVVITDLRMPGQDGLSLLRELRRIAPRTRTILLTGHPDVQSLMAAVNDLGVMGLYTKGCPPDDLIGKIRQALDARQGTLSSADILTPEERDFFKAG